MSLKQALEKAKKMRSETPAHSGPPEVQTAVSDSPQRPAEWKSPAYLNSQRVELNPAVLTSNRCVCIAPTAKEIDQYKVLRTKIQFAAKQKGWNTLMITSALEGEGKTLTAINLALTFAKAYNQTVLLVDGDLRRQTIHKMLGFPSRLGLVDYLQHEVPVKDIVVWPGIEQMTVISGGRTVSNSSELLGSPRMRALVEEMKSRYPDRTLIFDSAPVLGGADAMALTPFVDGIVVVVEAGRTGLRELRKAVAMLPADKIMGFVLNRQKNPSTTNYSYYG
ncbi:MAG: polysaccharide biosynthesis tyrosine autokinase [Desulfobacteraceae bacterium]|nr:MAG: polysaccharide biosynthesis tyrosine autokinase [Desulfobacteraceae bacterium]